MNLKPLMISCIVFGSPALAVYGASIERQLETAANSSGPDYLAARGAITRQGPPVLTALQKAADSPSLTWQQRLVARICCEWVDRSAEISALRRHAWEKDPDLKEKGNRAGLGADIYSLAAKRFKERRLWYYYLEVIWKETSEYSESAHSRSIFRFWPAYARDALRGEPEEYYRFQILRDILRHDPQIKSEEARNVFALLITLKRSEAMPELLAAFPHYVDTVAAVLTKTQAGKDLISRQVMSELLMIARPQDVDVLEKLLEANPHLKRLEVMLDAARKRKPVEEATEPSFEPTHESERLKAFEKERGE